MLISQACDLGYIFMQWLLSALCHLGHVRTAHKHVWHHLTQITMTALRCTFVFLFVGLLTAPPFKRASHKGKCEWSQARPLKQLAPRLNFICRVVVRLKCKNSFSSRHKRCILIKMLKAILCQPTRAHINWNYLTNNFPYLFLNKWKYCMICVRY